VLSASDLAAIMDHRPDLPLVCVDLGRPRNVERLADPISNLTLHDLDGLAERVEENRERQASEIPIAEQIVDEELKRFSAWRREREVVPVLTALRSRFFETGARAVEAQVKRVGSERRDEIERYTRALLAKLLHGPTTRLKEIDRGSGDGAALVEALRELFDLSEEAPDVAESEVPGAARDAPGATRDASSARAATGSELE
jgi:glutamyl-tRNA reductase